MDILEFKGEYRWLSNFYPFPVAYGAHVFPTVEHAFQAAKAPYACRNQFQCGTPAQAKQLGRRQKLPDNWEQIKVSVMRFLLMQKFAYTSDLGYKLRNTNGQLVEGNTWGDIFWGVHGGQGQNMLGKLLMEQRALLKAMWGL